MVLPKGILTKHAFLDEAQARLVNSRLSQNRKRGVYGKDDQLLGVPLDYTDNQFPGHQDRIQDHNTFMTQTFPDLLDQVKNSFEKQLGKTCFYRKEISFPGFRIFSIPARTKRTLWFHNDQVKGALVEQYPDLGVTESSRLITFIVLLNNPAGLTSGLLYFPDNELGMKIMNYQLNRHDEFEGFASLEIYNPGEINVIEECVHSIYAKNDSDEIRERTTFQGHLVEIPAGYLIFW